LRFCELSQVTPVSPSTELNCVFSQGT